MQDSPKTSYMFEGADIIGKNAFSFSFQDGEDWHCLDNDLIKGHSTPKKQVTETDMQMLLKLVYLTIYIHDFTTFRLIPVIVRNNIYFKTKSYIYKREYLVQKLELSRWSHDKLTKPTILEPFTPFN